MKFIETQSWVMSARHWRCGNGELFNGDRVFTRQHIKKQRHYFANPLTLAGCLPRVDSTSLLMWFKSNSGDGIPSSLHFVRRLDRPVLAQE